MTVPFDNYDLIRFPVLFTLVQDNEVFDRSCILFNSYQQVKTCFTLLLEESLYTVLISYSIINERANTMSVR